MKFIIDLIEFYFFITASKDLAQTSYFMATNSLHLTTMCLQYKPTVVACVCIHLACKWSSWEVSFIKDFNRLILIICFYQIPTSSEGKDWFYYVDPTVTPELLEELTSEFLAILDKCPSRLKRKIISHNNNNNNNLLGPINSNINSIIKVSFFSNISISIMFIPNITNLILGRKNFSKQTSANETFLININ